MYSGGIGLIITDKPLFLVFGTISLSLSMLLSWYLSHDCAHLLVFKAKKYNDFLGELLSWINGLAYFRFHEYRKDHLRHHLEQVDLAGVNVSKVLSKLPYPCGKITIFLEQCYIPIIFFIIKIHNIIGVIQSKNISYIIRVILVGLVSLLFLFWLAITHWWSPFLYFFAVIIRIHSVRFVDAFQHSYVQIDPSNRNKPQDKLYEQKNTFSYPVARQFKFLNLIILNFGFHNAHHAVPGCPWYNLPKINEIILNYKITEKGSLKINGEPHYVRFSELIYCYHKKLKERLTSTNEGRPYNDELRFSMKDFTGAFTDNLLG